MSVTPSSRELGRVGRLRSLADFYVTTMRTEIQTQFQYRAATYMYILGMVAEPVIARRLVDDADLSGGEAETAHGRRLRRVLHRLDARADDEHRLHPVRLGVADFRNGELSTASSASTPSDPLRRRRLRGRKIPWLVYYLPIAVILTLIFKPTFDVRPAEVVVFAIAIWGRT